MRNELAPTTAGGPYTLTLYTDNPVVTLQASQNGTAGEASFTYNWLASCNTSSPSARLGAELSSGLEVRVLGNPVQSVVEVEVTGAEGTGLTLLLTDLQSRILGQRQTGQVGSTERYHFDVSTQPAGVFVLRASTDNQTKAVRILKAN